MKRNTRKFRLVMSALTLVALLLSVFGAVPMQAGGPWYVNDGTGSDSNDCLSAATACKTIGGAIGKATAGDTINVANGTYTEEVTVDKSLTITGESEAGVIVEAAAAQTGSANTFTLDALDADITLEYMTIRHGDYGITNKDYDVLGAVKILHCTLYHNGWDGTGLPDPDAAPLSDFVTFFANKDSTEGSGGAIRIEGSAIDSEVADCTVYENDRGIRFTNSASPHIHDNTSRDNIQSGIYLSSVHPAQTGVDHAIVEDNEVYGNMNNGLLNIGGNDNVWRDNNVHDNWNSGVMLYFYPTCDGFVFENNIIEHNNLYSFNGQGVSGDAYGGVDVTGTGLSGSASAVKILGNTITNNQQGANPTSTDGVHFRGSLNVGTSPIEVMYNSFSGQDNDIHLLAQAATTVVNYNSFGTDYGIKNDDTTGVVDGEYNWWGDADGPEDVDDGSGDTEVNLASCGSYAVDAMKNEDPSGSLGDKVSDNVDYCPWLSAPATLWLELASPEWLAECNSSTIIVNVMMSANNFNGMEFDLDFDDALLDVVGVTAGSMWPGSATVVQNTGSGGTIEFAAYLQEANMDMSVNGGQVAEIEFSEKDTSGTSDLDFSGVIVSDLEGARIEPVELQDGSLVVKGCGCVHGIVELQGRFGPDWDGADIEVFGGPGGSYTTSVGNADGTWEICSIVEGDYDIDVVMYRYLDAEKTGVTVTDGGNTDVGQVKLLGGDCLDTTTGGGPYPVGAGDIDTGDASIVAGTFGLSDGHTSWDVRGDINDDATVNILDCSILGGNWNESGPIIW